MPGVLYLLASPAATAPMEPKLPKKRSPLVQLIAVVLILAIGLGVAYFVLTYRTGPAGEAPPPSAAPSGDAIVSIVTWNLYNFGGSKDAQEIAFIAQQLRAYDLVAIQEVSTTPPGAQAVARLDDALDRTGAAWDYVLSEATTGDGSERYAFLWKPSRLRLAGPAWLEASLAEAINREPFLARFARGDRQLLVASFHAVPQGKSPATENRLLESLQRRYPADNLLVAGDFNLSQQNAAFDGLKAAGLRPVLVDQRTTIRMRPRDDGHLANPYDNIFYETAPFQAGRSGVIDFTDRFPSLKKARTISDHLPVFVELQWN